MVEAPINRGGRRLTLILAGVGLVVGVGWLFGRLADPALERAKRAAIDCSNALYETGEGDPIDCRQTGLGLDLMRVLPWTRARVGWQLAELEDVVIDDQLDVATIRELDPEARDAAARALVALDRSEFPPQRLFNTFGTLRAAGAYAVMAERVSPDDSSSERWMAMQVALRLGDWDAAERIARFPVPTVSSASEPSRGPTWLTPNDSLEEHEFETAAIVLCIAGDREAARERLAVVDALHALRLGGPSLDARTIARRCGIERVAELPAFSNRFETSLDEANAVVLAGGTLDHEQLDWASNAARAITVARLAMADDPPFEWRYERPGAGDRLLVAIMSHRTRLTPHDEHGAPIAIAELEAAADRLTELAELAPVERPADPKGTLSSAWGEVAFHENPRAVLLWGAYCLANLATAERIWRGELDLARADLERVRKLTVARPGFEFPAGGIVGEYLALASIARLDPEAAPGVARRIAEPLLASLEQPDEIRARLALALVLDSPDEALALIDPAIANLAELESQATVAALELIAPVRWAHAGLRWRAEVRPEPRPPTSLRGADTWDLPVADYWLAAAFAVPSEQARWRWLSGGDAGLGLATIPEIDPIAFELVAQAAPPDTRDVWLDRATAEVFAAPLDYIRARVAAAERLDDAPALARWRSREAGFLARVRDDRTAALVRLLP